MNTTRTCSPRKEVIRVLAKKSDSLNVTCLPRQSTIILQHHNTFCSALTCNGGMCFEVRIVRGRIFVETGSLHDIFQHTTYITIYISDIEFTTLHTLDDFLYLCRLSWFHQVIASMYLINSRQSLSNTNPVSHHNTLKAPVITQDTCQQVVVTH